MDEHAVSLTEMAVLGVLAEGASHGFAIARALEAGSDIGRILTVRRPLVYRALDRLVELGMAEPVHTEPGSAGPQRVVHRITRSGRTRLRRWLALPVEHIRDMRIEFLLKVMFLHRGGASAKELVDAQMALLGPTVDALEVVDGDHVDSWRSHNAAAAMSFLEELSGRG